MSSTRRFLIASSLARLIEREKGARHLTEGFFPEMAERGTYVRVADGVGDLVLVEHGPHGEVEQTVTLPIAHAFALLDYTVKRIEYRQAYVQLGDLPVGIHRFTAPGPIDFVAIDFEQEEHARAFEPPPWFGPEVTTAPEHQHRRLAFDGRPEVDEVEITGTALNSLLDALQGSSADRQRRLVAPRLSRSRPPSSDAQPVDPSDDEDADIEDDDIRELARSLRPQHR